MRRHDFDDDNFGFIVDAPCRLDAPNIGKASMEQVRVRQGITTIRGRALRSHSSNNLYLLNSFLAKTIFGCIFKAIRLENRKNEDGEHVPTNEHVVVKMCDKMTMARNQDMAENPLQEISTMQHLADHFNIVQLVEACQDENRLYMVMPNCGEDLFSVVQHEGRLSNNDARDIFWQIIHAVSYCHRFGVAHRDLSLENVLARKDTDDGRFRCVIIDLGMGMNLPRHKQKSVIKGIEYNEQDLQEHDMIRSYSPFHCWLAKGIRCGKKAYVAPETFQALSPFHPMLADIWSLGSILFTMLTGFMLVSVGPTMADETYSKYLATRNIQGLFNQDAYKHLQLNDNVIDLLSKLLDPDPLQRPLIEEIMQHPWISGY